MLQLEKVRHNTLLSSLKFYLLVYILVFTIQKQIFRVDIDFYD